MLPMNGNNQQLSSLLQTAGFADIAMQAMHAWQTGKIPEFVKHKYDTNFMVKLFYDGSKDKTLKEILQGFGINLDNDA